MMIKSAQAMITTAIAPNQLPESIKLHQEIAQAVANQCIQFLQTTYHPKQIILFGSLVGDSPWHWQSDIDIAVLGLSEPQWWEAWGKLDSLCPSWLKIDLVRLETAPKHLRSRILQEKTMPKNTYLALKERIEDEMINIEETVLILAECLTQAPTVSQIFLTPSLASYIVDIYTGCEKISERVAVVLDEGMPKGENWHQELLQQVATPNNNRPALWNQELFLALDDYRKFRHKVLHNYGVKLMPARVLELAENMQLLMGKIRENVANFNQWLVSQSQVN